MTPRVHTSTARVLNSAKNPSIRNRNVYVIVPHTADQRIADVRQAREYWHLGVADARYTGPRSAYGRLLADAAHLVALLAARDAGMATPEQVAEIEGHGAPVAGWPGAARRIAA